MTTMVTCRYEVWPLIWMPCSSAFCKWVAHLWHQIVQKDNWILNGQIHNMYRFPAKSGPQKWSWTVLIVLLLPSRNSGMLSKSLYSRCSFLMLVIFHLTHYYIKSSLLTLSIANSHNCLALLCYLHVMSPHVCAATFRPTSITEIGSHYEIPCRITISPASHDLVNLFWLLWGEFMLGLVECL